VLRVNLRGVRDEPARDREHGPGIAKRHRPHGHPRGRNDSGVDRDGLIEPAEVAHPHRQRGGRRGGHQTAATPPERLFAAVDKELSAALDAQAGFAKPLITLAIGTKRYRDVKGTIVQMVLERLPETLQEAKDYTAKTLDIENLIVEKMNRLTPDQYEAILRPVFKDDEMLMVTVGAVLGFLVGEPQVVLVEHFGR